MSDKIPAQKLVPADPAFAERVRASFDRQGFMRLMGARLVEVAPGRVVIELDKSPEVTQQRGQIHGGAIGAIADSAGGYAAMSLTPPGGEVATVEYKINFMKPASGALLRATGEVIRAGRTLTICRIDVTCGDGTTMEPVAVLQATFIAVS
ncbi:MAG: PaaI family thioesterase [Hyphomicrobiales bacterium]|nr:PaaI family thioesterase [Hyphomicrobiales bacterium]